MDSTIFDSIPAFEQLSASTLAQLAEHSRMLSIAPRALLYRQDDVPSGLYALLTGRVKLYRESKDRMQIFAVLAAGECFGAESLIDESPSAYTAMALTPATLLYLPPATLRNLLAACPDLQLMLLDLVFKRLQQFVELVHSLAFRDVTSRLATALLALADEDGDEWVVHRLLTQQEIAAMVGTAREVVHRTLKKFERDHLIRVTPTKIFILDYDQLSEIAAQEAR